MQIIAQSLPIMALTIAIISFVFFIVGIRQQNQKFINSGKRGVIVLLGLASMAMLSLLYFLLADQFQINYVFINSSSDLPLLYKFTAIWAGGPGSLLLWGLLIALYTAMVTFSKKMKGNPMVPYIAIIMLANAIFFFFVLSFFESPFELVKDGIIPTEGRGMNPMLQNPGMIIHPITLFLGYAGLSVPFAFAMASLMLKNMDDFWIKMTRRWIVIAWLFLTLGNVFGGQWAYMELGWGGYWAWDAVENASFIPWLTASALLHSIMIQERKNMLKTWNVSLIIVSYALTIFGTYLVRSGTLSSVHAFAAGGWLGLVFLIFLVLIIAFSLYLLFSRMHLIQQDQPRFQSILSKETSFLINNLLLVTAAFTVFFGTIFPLLSKTFGNGKVSMGPEWFNQWEAPILLAVMVCMALCPLIAWQRSTVKNLLKNYIVPAIITVVAMIIFFVLGMRGFYPIFGFGVVAFLLTSHFLEYFRGVKARRKMTKESVPLALSNLMVRNRRRYGGYIVHIGIALIMVGIIGSQNFDAEVLKTVSRGEEIKIKDYTLLYEDLDQRAEGSKDIVFATFSVYKNDKKVGVVTPEKVFHNDFEGGQPTTEVGLLSTFKEDIYVILSEWESDDANGKATFSVKINPLMKWLWIGSTVVVIGTLFALWTGKYGNVTPRYAGIRKEVS